MNTPEKHHYALPEPSQDETKKLAAAGNATLEALMQRVLGGDTVAVEALRDLSNRAASFLRNYGCHEKQDLPMGMRGATAAIRQVAAKSKNWPCGLSAIAENRRDDLRLWERLDVGNALGMRLRSLKHTLADGKGRDFDALTQTGWAEMIHHLITVYQKHGRAALVHLQRNSSFPAGSWEDAIRALPPLSKASLAAWTDAALGMLEALSNGDFTEFECLPFIRMKAASIDDENGHVAGSKKAVRQKISEGFKALCPDSMPPPA